MTGNNNKQRCNEIGVGDVEDQSVSYRDFYKDLFENTRGSMSGFFPDDDSGDIPYESKHIRPHNVYDSIASELTDEEKTNMIHAVAMQLEEIYEDTETFYDSYSIFKAVESLEPWQLVRAVDELYAYPCGWERLCDENGLEKWKNEHGSVWSID